MDDDEFPFSMDIEAFLDVGLGNQDDDDDSLIETPQQTFPSLQQENKRDT